MDYKEQLLTSEWRKKREHILNIRGRRCEKCGSNINLHVHHSFYINGRMAWEYEDHQLNVLCNKCHSYQHKNDKPSHNKKHPYSNFMFHKLSCGYTKISNDVLKSDISHVSKWIYCLIAICEKDSFKNRKFVYRSIAKEFNLSPNTLSKSVKELECCGFIQVKRTRNSCSAISEINQYFILDSLSGCENIPNCLILHKGIKNQERVLLITALNYLINNKIEVKVEKLALNINGHKERYLYKLFKTVSDRDNFKWITKNHKNSPYTFNYSAIIELDNEVREYWRKP